MKLRLIYILVILSLFGCKTKTIIQYVPVPVRHDSIVERIIRDTVAVYPAQQQQVIGAKKSHLETDLSWSDASVDTAGLLKHSISNKGLIPARIITLTTTVHDSISVPYPVKGDPYPVEVVTVKYRRDLIWWIGLSIMALSAIYIFFKLKKKLSL